MKNNIPKQYRRITEVWSNSSGGSYGTGYFIGGGLVLTALHVLRDTGEPLPEKIKARPLGSSLEHRTYHKAEIIWPVAQDLDEIGVPDAALLRIADQSFGSCDIMEAGPPCNTDENGACAVSAVGFPALATLPNEQRDTEEIVGRVQLGTGLLSMSFMIADVRGATNESIDERLEWRGMSGAGLMSAGRLVGILLARKSANSRYDFSGLRIDRLLQYKEFSDAIGPHLKICDGEPVTREHGETPVAIGLPPLLEKFWDRLDHDLQDAFALAATDAQRQGKNYISTTTLFAALRRIGADPLPEILSVLPPESVAEPSSQDLVADYRALGGVKSLSNCVSQSMSKLAPKVGRASVLASEDLFVDIARHGTGKSTRQLRTHGVHAKDIERLVGQLGWIVVAR